MNILTRDFGEIEINESDIISFPEGLYAFEDVDKFVMLSSDEANVDAYWLQSVADPTLCFILFKALSIIPNYAPIYSHKELNAIEATSDDNLEYYLIAVIPSEFKNTTVNLKSPVAINKKNGKAKQIIVDNSDYQIKHYLFDTESRRCLDADSIEKS